MECTGKSVGMKFPPQIDRATGRFVTVVEKESIRDSVYLILMTQKTERLARPEFGSEILAYPFTDTNPTLLHVMERQMKETLLSQEPRIDDVEIQTEFKPQEACLYIHINYTVAKSKTEGSMTIPFDIGKG